MIEWNDVLQELKLLEEEEKQIMYDIDDVIGRLEAIENDGVLPILDELERIRAMTELAYERKDGPAYIDLVKQQLALLDHLKNQTKNIRAELNILYEAKEICLRHGCVGE